MLEHVLRVAGGESASLCAQVEEDGIRFPSSEGMDGCLIDSGYEQGGGSPPRADAVGCDSGWRDVGDVFDVSSGDSKFLSEHGSGDLVLHHVGVKVGVQWCVGWSGMLLEMQDSTLAGTDGAEDIVARESMSKGFTMHSILLVSVGEGDVHPCLHIM